MGHVGVVEEVGLDESYTQNIKVRWRIGGVWRAQVSIPITQCLPIHPGEEHDLVWASYTTWALTN